MKAGNDALKAPADEENNTSDFSFENAKLFNR